MTQALRFSPNVNWLFTEPSLENRPAAAAKAGFRAVECSRPYQLPAAQWRSQLHGAGVDQVLINTPTDPTNSATEFGAACPLATATSSDKCQRRHLNAPSPSTARRSTSWPDTTRFVPAELVLDTYLENVAGPRANAKHPTSASSSKRSTRPARRVHPSQAQAAKIVETLGSDRVRLLFDISHCQRARGDLARTFQRLSPVVRHAQIADAPGRAELPSVN
jgi:hydroxypyruvate isomerase